MPSQGPNSPSSASTTIQGTADWNTPNNALVQDDVGTTALGIGLTYWLNVQGFGFAIPVGATITDLTVTVRVKDAIAQGIATGIQLTDSSAGVGNENASSIDAATYVDIPLGGNATFWNTALTPAVVNASTFGVRYRTTVSIEEFNTVSVDVITVTIAYTGGSATTSRLKLRKVG
jgi:hypothetical protein